MSNKLTKSIEGNLRDHRIKEGYYDGRFGTKSVPNKRLEFLEECDTDFDTFLLDEKELKIVPSPHRL